MWLWVRNVGTETLPFGLGFHPWLVRTPGALLQAKAKRVVLEDNDHLPDGEADVASCVEWDFATPRALPRTGSTTPFSTGTVAPEFFGRADLDLMSTADPQLSTYIAYSPSAKADFFCFEPVTHSVDAHNLPGDPVANGLTILAPQETVSATCRFCPRRLN